jgi:hypothetical protein
MKTEFIPFPPNARQFFLRSDFAFELCFADFAQSRGARHCFNVAYLLDEEPAEWIFKYDDDLVKLYETPRFFAYCLAVMRRSQKQVPLVGDGHLWMPAPRCLFTDLLRRTNTTHQSGIVCNPVVASVPTEPRDKWLFPRHVVLHDTLTQSAAVVGYDVAKGYLAMNRPSR